MRRFSVPLPKGNPYLYTYEDIYSEYWEPIRDYAYSTSKDFHHAEDVAQEVMLQVFKRLDWINREKLAPAIATITSNTIIDMYRAEKGLSSVTYFEDELTFECHDDGIADPIHAMVRDEKMVAVNQVYKELPEHESELFTDFYIEGLGVPDICAKYHITRGAVYIRLHRMRSRFIEAFGNLYEVKDD